MNRWRPTPEEERWLVLSSRLDAPLPHAALAVRTGGWRSTGLLARIALFVLGGVAAVLLFGILGFGDAINLLVAGLIAALTAEWLAVSKRLHASGIEEGLSVAGFLLVGAWVTTIMGQRSDFAGGTAQTLVLIAAAGAAGLRLLNPFVTTCAVIALVGWLGSTTIAQTLDQALGRGVTAFAIGCAFAALALALGHREFRRPSHDRMLDWLVATLPVAAYAQQAAWHHDAGRLAAAAGALSGPAATAALLLTLGIALLVAGLRRRRHAPLLGFMGCVACLAVELRTAASLGIETWLALCGLAALVTGIALERLLRQPRDGLTSVALTGRDDPLDLLQTAGAAVLAQRTSGDHSSPSPEFTPGGGRFGGGGASGSY
jgi:hypothetical protein